MCDWKRMAATALSEEIPKMVDNRDVGMMFRCFLQSSVAGLKEKVGNKNFPFADT
jgi:hypothetical protein